MKIYVLDLNEKIRELPDVLVARHTESLNGESVLDLTSVRKIEKYEHIIYQDSDGIWHEFVVSGVDELHNSAGLTFSIFCESVLSELRGDWIDDRRIVNLSAETALERALDGTRWQVGTVDALGTGTVNFYRESAFSAVGKILETYGAELRTRITVTDGKIAARHIDLLTARGQNAGARFEWNRNVAEVKREISRDDIITALHGFGRGEEVGDGFGRRLSFADINGGLTYVADEDARRPYGRVSDAKTWEGVLDTFDTWADAASKVATWAGLPDAIPYGREHRHGSVLFDDVTDMAELKSKTEAMLAAVSKPSASYSAKVVDFTDAGLPRVGLGDTVAVIDDDLGIETQLRVVEIRRDVLDPTLDEIALGRMTTSLAGSMARQTEVINGLRSVFGVTKMVSEDGKSWLDYSVPEFILDGGAAGRLELSTENILQMFDKNGNLAAGFTEVDGQQGFMVPFVGNTADGSGGTMSLGFGSAGGQGIQFKVGDHTFMWTFDVAFGVQLYVDGKPRQVWSADGGSVLLDQMGRQRFAIDSSSGDIVFRDHLDTIRMQIYGANGFTIRDSDGKERIVARDAGDMVIWDRNGVQRLQVLNNGETGILDAAGNTRLIANATDTVMVFGAHALGVDDTGPYKVVSGVKSYL